MLGPHQSRPLGLICIAVAVVAAFLWIPFDSATGLTETVRRRTSIGDGLAPTVAAFFIGLGGLLLWLPKSGGDEAALSLSHLRFLLALLAGLVLVFGLMRWAGPLVAWLAGTDEGYRLLRATAPWKWVGFALGGVLLVTGSIAAIERRLTLRACVIGVVAVAALIAVFDLPFDDLLLPPNGDV